MPVLRMHDAVEMRARVFIYRVARSKANEAVIGAGRNCPIAWVGDVTSHVEISSGVCVDGCAKPRAGDFPVRERNRDESRGRAL